LVAQARVEDFDVDGFHVSGGWCRVDRLSR
jgi:hypothetical protein